MTPHGWDIAEWAHRRWRIAEDACGLSKPLKDKPAFDEWNIWMNEEAIYAEILALSIYADESLYEFIGLKFLNQIDPHALLDWLREKKAKQEGEDCYK